MDDRGLVKQRDIQAAFAAAFPNPQAYSCSILAYIRSHSLMIIEVVQTVADAYRPLYLELETVWYIEGPLRWHGVDFRLASNEECKALLETGWVDVHDHVDEFVRHHVLLILERPAFRVRVMAGNCIISNKSPTIQISTP